MRPMTTSTSPRFDFHAARTGFALLAVLSVSACGGGNESVDPVFGATLTVNGESISSDMVKRNLVYADPGSQYLRMKQVQIYIEEEIARQIEAGADPEKFRISEGDLDEVIAEADADTQTEFPDGEFSSAREVYAAAENVWRDQVRQGQLFQTVFLPDNPNDYPDITVAALMEQGKSPDFIDRLKEGYKLRQEDPELDAAAAQGRQMFKMLLSSMVTMTLDKTAEVRRGDDGLAPDIAMEVNGRSITVGEIWPLLEALVTPEDIYRQKLWFARTVALRQDLETLGFWMSDEEFEAAYLAHTEPYAASPFNIPTVAVQFKKFPSESDYKIWFRISESYKKMTAADITDQNLEAHLMQRANNLLGLGTVDCEVILVSAYDFSSKSWKENGWVHAEARAGEVMRALADGRDWDEVLNEYCDFYDPPIAQSMQGQPNQNALKKGRFGPTNRNQLMRNLEESDFSNFLMGSCVADSIFFDQSVGSVDGPFRGARGYYIIRVKGRQPAARQLSLADKNQRDLIEQDYLAVRMSDYAAQVLDRAEVSGL